MQDKCEGREDSAEQDTIFLENTYCNFYATLYDEVVFSQLDILCCLVFMYTLISLGNQRLKRLRTIDVITQFQTSIIPLL